MGFLQRLFGGASAPSQPEWSDLRADEPAHGYRRLTQGRSLAVVGESNYRADIEFAVGCRPEGHHDVVDAVLIWEPTNPYDENAIAVQVAGRTCGYISRADSQRYRPVMEWCRDEGFLPIVRADVRGGGQQGDGSWMEFGIKLYVASPDRLLGRPEPPQPVPSRDHPWLGQLIAFTGDSCCAINGEKLDRVMSEVYARAAGMQVHERVTKKVQLLVDCDEQTVSGNQRKALEYGIPVVSEQEFWTTLGLTAERV